jgi:micrococcal nuclease
MRYWMTLLTAMLAFSVHAQTLHGVVTHVSDGDTFSLAVDKTSKPIKVRLQGIDAPEICQAGGKQARDALRVRLLRQTVRFDTFAKDSYRRTIARVYHLNEDVGQWQVSQGHAWSDSYQSRRGPYAAEQAQAKAKRLGLWAQSDKSDKSAIVLEPREFRKTFGRCKN